MEQASDAPRILIVEDDQSLGDLLSQVFLLEGYQIQLVATLEGAQSWLAEQAVDLVLTDSFSSHPALAFERLEALLRHAYPIPVGVLSGWNLPPEEMAARGFAFLVAKPFDLKTLLVSVAAALAIPWSDEQRLQAAAIERFFASINARAWEDLLSLCSEQVRQHIPAFLLPPRSIEGVAAVRAYLEEFLSQYSDTRFDEVRCYPTPEGIAVRYTWRWSSPAGVAQSLTNGELFYFVDGRVAQIGNERGARQLRELMEQRASAQAS